MFDVIGATIQPMLEKSKVLEIAYDLYLEAPQSSSPEINLREVAQRTGVSLFECRNAIVTANRSGRFPNCSLVY
ncbi:MAG: hypothetical protein SFW36_22680 [Leptolyngbyaceae cyanobacterium bins.59]|nr:hypothetical protein [Leptolyngbyaceae cyanobacterium bins.59]